VARMLEGKIPVQAPIINRSSMDQEARFKAFEPLSQDRLSLRAVRCRAAAYQGMDHG